MQLPVGSCLGRAHGTMRRSCRTCWWAFAAGGPPRRERCFRLFGAMTRGRHSSATSRDARHLGLTARRGTASALRGSAACAGSTRSTAWSSFCARGFLAPASSAPCHCGDGSSERPVGYRAQYAYPRLLVVRGSTSRADAIAERYGVPVHVVPDEIEDRLARDRALPRAGPHSARILEAAANARAFGSRLARGPERRR
jgi:hypothetical protein